MAYITKTPATAYLTSETCLYPGTAAQALVVAAQARLDVAGLIPVKGGSTPVLTNGKVVSDPSLG